MQSQTIVASASLALIPLLALPAAPIFAEAKARADACLAEAEMPIVIGHRGASGFRPEHTLEAYELAVEQGADFIEPDLVATKDGVLIVRHENELSGTTDVDERPEFADRETTKVIDGVSVNGWFSEDFTLEEIKTLRAEERIPDTRPENTTFDGQFEIPTLEEVIALVRDLEKRTQRKVGIYPETKHPTYFAKEGEFLDGGAIEMSLGKRLIETLVAQEFTDPERVFIQSFEFENLIELQNDIMPSFDVDLPLVQLYGDIENAYTPPESSFSAPYDMVYNAGNGDVEAIYGRLDGLVGGDGSGITAETDYGDLVSAAVLDHIAEEYAEGIGPWKNSFLLRETLDEPVDADGDGEAEITTRLTGEVAGFLARAIDAGLLVHPYTLRAEEAFLTLHPNGIPQTLTGEVVQLLGLGVNGFFTDQPVTGVEGRTLFLEANGCGEGR
ncbi:glycerophosphoryl diester phosphodiesterase [Modicisalibacter ilicicola DSM 19980]|uniref:glycerophosphodiester phosphodiesterase n=1 Tax=Modicisalibacter ilicicola DSM 19980 TaxID=1121942 RepID=A0A1M5BYF2_9GAMM|nr:glycerophosphodiester phosphodiesterase family protein [Halomonas ilicicola]SHF47548.1 glycerophosphoryl diester phosphodiesterase [Halomonas ilicicola DSM 19980]